MKLRALVSDVKADLAKGECKIVLSVSLAEALKYQNDLAGMKIMEVDVDVTLEPKKRQLSLMEDVAEQINSGVLDTQNVNVSAKVN